MYFFVSLRKMLAKKVYSIFSMLIIANLGVAPAFSGGPAFEGLVGYAKKVSVGVLTPAGSGSGIIIGKKGNTYLAITAKHVVSGFSSNEEGYVYPVATSKAKSKIINIVVPEGFKNLDLALITFDSANKLDIAPVFALAPDNKAAQVLQGSQAGPAFDENVCSGFKSTDKYMPSICKNFHPISLSSNATYIKEYRNTEFNGRTYDLEYDVLGEPMLSGVSVPTQAVPIPLYRTTVLELQPRVVGNKNGYELVYLASSTVPGMSGGGVFSSRKCPQLKNSYGFTGIYGGLIGVHGMSEEYGQSGSRSGASLGIPLDLVTKELKLLSNKYGIPSGESYVKLVRDTCDSMPGIM